MASRLVRVIAACLIMASLSSCSGSGSGGGEDDADFSGNWTWAYTPGGTVRGEIYLVQTGTSVTGWWTGTGGGEGHCQYHLQCTATGNTMSGSSTYDPADSQGGCGANSQTVQATLNGDAMTLVLTQAVGNSTTIYAKR